MPAAPAEAVDCGSATQGTYDRDNDTFTPGTSSTDTDYSLDCTEDATDSDDVITLPDNLPAGLRRESYLVINLNGAAAFQEGDGDNFKYVLKASGVDTSVRNREGVTVSTAGANRLFVEVRGLVDARGDGGMGVLVEVDGSGTATAINRGTINTHGGVDASGSDGPHDFRAHGLYAGSNEGVAFTTNYGHVETRGDSADAILAYTGTDGTATATNYGTAIVRGGTSERVHPVSTDPSGNNPDQSSVGRPNAAIAVQAYSEGGTARAVNMAGGTAEAHGQGTTAVEASTGGYIQTGGSGRAVAENFGTVTSTGAVYEVTDSNNLYHGEVWVPAGVAAHSQGSGEAQAANRTGGMVETTGDGGRGVFAWSGDDGTGDAMATNSGTVVTRGDRVVTTVNDWIVAAIGVAAQSEQANATAINDVGGTVDTHGTRAHGVWALADVGTARVVNRGNVTTNNTVIDLADIFALPAYGLNAYSPGGNAEVENEATGYVNTKGQWAFGILAQTENDGARTSARAEAVNKGRVLTEGPNGDGVLAIGTGGTASNPNVIIARNEAGATITAMGDGADGLVAAINVGDAGTANGSVRAENHGTITTSGAAEGDDDGNTDAGVSAVFFTFETTPITDAGDATVVNTGDVTVSGARATGLRAVTFGSGTATVEMRGGTVTASAEDDPSTADIDESGVGLAAWTGDTGTAAITVTGNSQVSAPIAARLEGGTTQLLLHGGLLEGDVIFGDGTNTLETRWAGIIDGDVVFGAGQDTLILNVLADYGISGINGSITGLEEMFKRGSGTARVHDVMFSGSTLRIEEGGLIVRGHLDLGEDGTVTVKDSGRLTIEIGDVGTDQDDHGKITAGEGVTLEGNDPAVFAAYDPALDELQKESAQQHMQTQGVTPFGTGTDVIAPSGKPVMLKTETETGDVETVGSVTAGTAMLDDDKDLATAPETEVTPIPPQSPVSTSTARSASESNRSILALGGGAVFLFLLSDLLWGDEESDAGGFAAVPLPSAFDGTSSDGTDTGTRYWVRALTDETLVAAGGAESLRGLNMGFTTRIDDGFHLGLSGTPLLKAEPGDNAFHGRHYALRGGWSAGKLFANVGLSRGDYVARTAFANLDGLGKLGGTFDMQHEQARADVGARLEIDGLRLDPSLSLFAGSLDQEAYTAGSAALRAQIPALSRRYDGWKARVGLAPEDWLEAGSVRWRPELSLATARTSTDGPDGLRVRQADRAGVLSFSTPAKAQELPQTMHAFGAGVSIAKAEDWKLRGGYLAMMADGQLIHAAIARFKLRF